MANCKGVLENFSGWCKCSTWLWQLLLIKSCVRNQQILSYMSVTSLKLIKNKSSSKTVTRGIKSVWLHRETIQKEKEMAGKFLSWLSGWLKERRTKRIDRGQKKAWEFRAKDCELMAGRAMSVRNLCCAFRDILCLILLAGISHRQCPTTYDLKFQNASRIN